MEIIATSHPITAKGKEPVQIDVARANVEDMAGFVRQGYAISPDDALELWNLAAETEKRAAILTRDDERDDRREAQALASRIRRNLAALGFKGGAK